MTTFAALNALRREVADVDKAVTVVLRKLDELLRCQAVIERKVTHLHDDMARRKVRRRDKG